MPSFDFIGGEYQSRSVNADAQQCVNLFLEVDPGSPSGKVLYGTHGSTSFITLGAALQVRGAGVDAGTSYFVCGNKFYSVTTGNVATELGTLSTNSGVVQMETNGLVMLLVDGQYGYTYTYAGGAFAVVADVDFPAFPVGVCILDQTFVVVEGGTQRFWISVDGTTWDSADFASAEAAPDNLIGCAVDHQELFLGGEKTCEIWYNSGDASFTFARRAVIETGLAGRASICKADNSLFFLGSEGVVWRLNAYTPVRVSTHAIETAIRAMGAFDDCMMWAQKDEGHVFIWLQFPGGDQTWVFDVASGFWHRRAYRNTISGELERHRANCYVEFNGRHIVGDYEDGRLYDLSLDIYDDDGDPMPSIRVCRSLGGSDTDTTVAHASLAIKFETGVGLETGQGSDPQAMLKWSDDSGHTWSNPVWRSMGQLGEYDYVTKWNRLGSVRSPNSRVYWVEITDPVKRVITDAYLAAA